MVSLPEPPVIVSVEALPVTVNPSLWPERLIVTLPPAAAAETISSPAIEASVEPSVFIVSLCGSEIEGPPMSMVPVPARMPLSCVPSMVRVSALPLPAR